MAKKKSTKKKTQKPFRDIETDGITYSFLQEFLLCREQARLSYVEGFTDAGVSEALDFGSAFHELLEHVAEGSPLATCKQRLEKFVNFRIKEAGLKKPEIEQLRRISNLVVRIFPLYYNYWKQRDGVEHKSDFVCQEYPFAVPHQIGGHQILLRGRFDAIFRMQGKLWLMENKTKSNIDEEGITASLAKDLQTMLYCHAIRLQYGEYPEGVLYNVIRRPTNRLGKTETHDEFVERVYNHVKGDQDRYFMRWNVTLGPDDLDAWVQRTLNPLLLQVIHWWNEIKDNPFNPWKNPDRMHHFENPEGLYTKYGRSKFFELLTRKSTYGLRKRQK